jgi:hypothetical protein
MTKKWRTLWKPDRPMAHYNFSIGNSSTKGEFSIAVSDCEFRVAELTLANGMTITSFIGELNNCNGKPLLAKGKDQKRRLLHVPSLLLRLAYKQMTVSSADFIGVPTLL